VCGVRETTEREEERNNTSRIIQYKCNHTTFKFVRVEASIVQQSRRREMNQKEDKKY
jgi:hypothetical protein